MMRFHKKILLVFLMTIGASQAADEAVFLPKDTKSPYDGILLPVDKANQVRKDLIELNTLRAINESYQKSIQLYEQSIQLNDKKNNILLDQNEKLSTELVKARSSTELQKVIWFTLGVLASGFAVYGAKKITQ